MIVYTPQNTAERVEICGRFANDFPLHPSIEVVVDSLDHGEQFMKRFAPWPIRMYLVEMQPDNQNPILRYVMNPKEASIPFDELFDAISAVTSS